MLRCISALCQLYGLLLFRPTIHADLPHPASQVGHSHLREASYLLRCQLETARIEAGVGEGRLSC